MAETGNFTRTAKMNAITQSAVSQKINSLEQYFNVRLIERSKKQFALTREGQALCDSGKKIVQTFESLQHEIQEIKNIVTGTIRVATIYSIGLHELPPYQREFMKKHPTVNLSVKYHRASQLYEDILSNSVDIGLVAYPTKDNRFETVPLHDDLLVLICHPDHPLALEKTLKLDKINNHKFISFEPDIPTRRAIDKILRDRNIAVDHVMEFDNIETIKRAVEIDAGISIAPKSTVTQEVAKKTITQMKIAGENHYRPLAAVHKKNKILSPAMKEFLKMLKGK